MVVVNYRTPNDLARFCQSVLIAPPEIEWHLTVVNVAVQGHDSTMLERIRHHYSEQGFLANFSGINELDNVGYARACNEAAARATEWDHDVLAFFNADVTLPAGAVDQCVAALVNNPDWGVVGPRQVDSKGRLTHAGIFGTLEHPQHRAWRQPNETQYGDIRPAVTVSGSAYFIRRSLWDLLTDCPKYRAAAPMAKGAFLPTPHYFEETYCSYHVQAHGAKVMYYGPVCIHHEWHQASPVGGWAERQFPISQKIFRQACDIHGIPHD
jgi:cellulose synthase/poly-beta-1,6-N-acetylglucosamine synthase-like glycosyltransferase